MTDLFNEKADEWDGNDRIRQLSHGVGSTLLQQVVLDAAMEVMDFGAGTGLISSHVAPRVQRIVAVDISSSMLEKLAQKPHLQDKVEIVCQNILEQPLERKFDLIISAMALHHVEDTQKLMQRFKQHLKPGGRVALADLDAEDGSFHPADTEGVYHQGFDRDQLRTLLEQQGFSEVNFVTAHTVINDEQKAYPVFLLTATAA